MDLGTIARQDPQEQSYIRPETSIREDDVVVQ